MEKLIQIDHLDLRQIAESGQCFRWKQKGDDTYVIPGLKLENGRLADLQITQLGEEFKVSCSEDDWNSHWSNYFDLSTDYKHIEAMIMDSSDEHAKVAFADGEGIRILRQDLWEIIVTFLISQNNNIKRITASVEEICRRNNGLFPYPGEIDSKFFDDRTLGLGYRVPYLSDIYEYALANPSWLDELRQMSYEDAFSELKKRNGIGPKVANCICLFGLHHIDAFPIDTHVKTLLERYYPNGFDFNYYAGFAGIVQQYLFYYELKH